MPENHIKVAETDKKRFQQVILLSEKSEKVLSEYAEQLKNTSFTSLMGVISKGVPDEIIKALDDYKQCSDYFKALANAYITNKAGD